MSTVRLGRVGGWTRQELLVVIGVVAVAGVLLAVGIPAVLRNAREKQRRINCAGNLKQMGLTLLMYSGDFDHYFPNEAPDTGVAFELRVLKREKYTSDGWTWYCPSASFPWGPPYRMPVKGGRSPTGEQLYTYVRDPLVSSTYRYIGSGLRDDMANPGLVSMAFDVSGNHPNNSWINVLFIDGHVQGAKPGENGWSND